MSIRASNCSRRLTAWISSPGLICALLAGMTPVLGTAAAKAQPVTCPNGSDHYLPTKSLQQGKPDLKVEGECVVLPGVEKKYFYGNVNIVGGGTLMFRERDWNGKYIDNTTTDFWASSIVIENKGALDAHAGPNASQGGRFYGRMEPYGTHGGVLTIHLYGRDQSKWNTDTQEFTQQNQGVLCQSQTDDKTAFCGIPKAIWDNNGKTAVDLPGGVHDFFYQYGPLYGDKALTDGKVGYFGTKTLAVSYGGTLDLAGSKGACHDIDIEEGNFPCYGVNNADPLRSGPSWTRLAADLRKDEGVLRTEDVLRAAKGDEIVVTTTDYLPGHSEPFKIKDIDGAVFLTLETKAQWPHNGTRFPLKERLTEAKGRLSLDPELVANGVETRAAVALLTRSIRIVSAGDEAGADFSHHVVGDKEDPHYAFGAHLVIRQGFEKVQIQGVEFKQMGQGGRLGHYPVHFHMARKTPKDTWVKDSSVNESMTRWYVIHSTQGVTLARNVGYKSIGHGYYLEDGTETDNNLYSNIGILARAAVDNEQQNPRNIPGILSANAPSAFPYNSDYQYPSAFWITNGWNQLIGNAAAGAGTCGACYWFVPAYNSDMPDVPTDANSDGKHMKWTDEKNRLSYAGLQRDADHQGATPLRSFYKNYCSSAMHSFVSTSEASGCVGVVAADIGSASNQLAAVKSIAPKQDIHPEYYPNAFGGARKAAQCPMKDGGYDCTGVAACSDGNEHCAVTVLDHYTSAFHWAEHNFAAIWLRPQWYLVDNSVLSDIQNPGLGIVTGGDYTHSSVIPGFWGVARKMIFIGHTQPQDKEHAFAADKGPFNSWSAQLDPFVKCEANGGGYCLNKREGVSLPLSNFAVGQRFFNIYDGPSYQDSNAFLDIRATECAGTKDGCIYGFTTSGVRKARDGSCYLPNAAVAWKQPNGFIYPPAFHSTNLFFNNVAIRHYVIEPRFEAPQGVTGEQDFGQGGTYLTDGRRAADEYCGSLPTNFFAGFSGIDRQTELNDDDGSLTGLVNSVKADQPRLKQTISINEDSFFDAPVKTAECKSNVGIDPNKACPVNGKLPQTETPATALTSPYDYVTTVIVPGCSTSGSSNGGCGDDKKNLLEQCSAQFPNCCNTDNKNICDDRFAQMLGRGGDWSRECTNESCYGVPLYRQFLTGVKGKDEASSTREWAHWFKNKCDTNQNTPQCRWPFMRMAGEDFYQRNSLTVNHGMYFLDTSNPREQQFGKPGTPGEKFDEITPCQVEDKDHCKPRSVNVFKAGETYYVFFLYAKQSTEQTYQIYVGDGFDLNTIKGVRMKIDVAPVSVAGTFSQRPSWLAEPQLANGILTATVNFKGVTELDPSPDNLCQPKTFCKSSGGKCVSALDSKDPILVANPSLQNEANEVCGRWAVKDLDCPAKGCFGFSFTLSADRFKADATIDKPTPHRPLPTVFPTVAPLGWSQPDWMTQFEPTETLPDKAQGGACFYPNPLPGSAGCPVVQ